MPNMDGDTAALMITSCVSSVVSHQQHNDTDQFPQSVFSVAVEGVGVCRLQKVGFHVSVHTWPPAVLAAPALPGTAGTLVSTAH